MENVLNFVAFGYGSQRSVREPHRHCVKHPVANTVVELAHVTEAPRAKVQVANARGFRKLEERAAMLGIRMAQQGFAGDENPYTAINEKLAAIWLSSFGKYQGTTRSAAQ